MSSDLAIRVRDLSKRYLMYSRPEDRLKQMILPRLARLTGAEPRDHFTPFDALKNVDLDVHRGETVGIVGRNGSGKSTLLQLICGTLSPSAGSVEVHGRIAALLELGSGFNADFTGRENVFLNSAIMGLTRAETEARFDEIARFADIGVHLEHPVKTYSSGMYVRLAFAVAINVDPDILVVDEALAVGDEAFQRKCFARIEQIRDNGSTILFVSHGAQTIVQLCDRAVLIDHGEKIMDGKPKSVVQQYQRLVNASQSDAASIRAIIQAASAKRELTTTDLFLSRAEYSGTSTDDTEEPSMSPVSAANSEEKQFIARHDASITATDVLNYNLDGAEISDLRIETLDGRKVNVIGSSEQYKICYQVTFYEETSDIAFGFQLKTVSGLVLAGCNTSSPKESRLRLAPASSVAQVEILFTCNLLPGTYFADVGAHTFGEGFKFLHRLVDALAFRVESVEFRPTVGNTFVDAKFAVRISKSMAAATADSL